MKIVHISISAPFTDGWGYQENLLTRYLQQAGTQNFMVASANDFAKYVKPEVVEAIKEKGSRYKYDGVEVWRIPTKKFSDTFVFSKGLRQVLEDIQPDLIFHHNFNSTSLPICARYAKAHQIPMMVDNHADSLNMTKRKLWVLLYYKGLIGLTCMLYRRQIFKAYGVTHSRCDFIHDYYGLPQSKIDFLPIGADVDLADTIGTRDDLRAKYGFSEDDFIVVTGGKMGRGKGTDALIRAVEFLRKDNPRVRLILFGSFQDNSVEMQAQQSDACSVIGWCDRIKTLELLKLSNVACWPIHHTTLIEDAISVRTPLICRKTGTTEHLIDGNGFWVKKGTMEELTEALLRMLRFDIQQQLKMKAACESMRETISYHSVANKIIKDASKFNR